MKKLSPPLILCALLLGGCELGVKTEWINGVLFPAPSQIFASLWGLKGDFLLAFWETGSHSWFAFFLAAILGIGVAVSLSLIPWLRRAVLPFAIFFQTVPIIAIAPLLVIYFGFGPGTVIASAVIVSIFPVLANTLIGLESMDPGDVELFRLYKASRAQILFKLQLPRAYTSIYSGLKIAAGLAVIGAVAGEFVAGSGLGALIDSARTQQRIDLVFGALLLLSLIGLLLIAALRGLNALINRFRPYGLHLRD